MTVTVVRGQQIARTGRVTRSPTHHFQVRHLPWVIQPVAIAPVIPAETLKNFQLRARVVSDPVKNPLLGWWLEYYCHYVKLRDLDARDALSDMMLTPDYDASALFSAARLDTYHKDGTVDFVEMCRKRVVEEYFRDDEEAYLAGAIGALPLSSVRGGRRDWTDSLTDVAPVVAEDVPIPVVDPPGPISSGVMASDVEKALRMWEYARAYNLTDQSFEDYLATHGIRPAPQADHRPELIRTWSQWTYPTNHIEPTTGAPSSALSWAVAERGDKDFFFREPGFLVLHTVVRPKVYLSRQTSTLTGQMSSAFDWLPAVLGDDPWSSVRAAAAGSEPLAGASAGYWYDVKDLFLYGEQFVNFALAETDAGFVALPTAAMQKKYVSQADINGLFVAADKNLIRQDGIVDFSILGAQTDTTPRGFRYSA